MASVEGFRLAVLLTCEYIFGLRMCENCPNCNRAANANKRPCQDLFGNNSFSEGGAFGRADGISISAEAQKSAGSLHAHGQLHVECMHQHRPLVEVMAEISRGKSPVVQEYLRYKRHVCREEYEDAVRWGREDRVAVEEAWPSIQQQ